MFSHSMPPTPTPPTHHISHRLCCLTFVSIPFPPCSSPHRCLQVPIIVASSIFATVTFPFACPHWLSLQTHTTFNHINLCQLIKLSTVLVGPPLRTTPWRSRISLVIRIFLFICHMFHCPSFDLVLALPFILFCLAFLIGLQATSLSFQCCAHFHIAKLIYSLSSN